MNIMFRQKECTKCGIVKKFFDFPPNKKTSTGKHSYCRACGRLMVKNWGKKNPEKVRQYIKKSLRGYWKKRGKADPKYRLNMNISHQIRSSLKGKKAGRSWEKLVGYTVEDLVEHIEKRFEQWMSWGNYGKWHIDHIIPKSHFKYESAEAPEFKNCWALENLQPLEAIANIKKSNKIQSNL